MTRKTRTTQKTANDAVELDALADTLKHGDPDAQRRALRTLEQLRGYDVLQVIEIACRSDDAGIREEAQRIRKEIELDTSLFGAGRLLRLEIAPPLPSPEEHRRRVRRIWIIWLFGAFLTINAWLVREHTDLRLTPTLVVILIGVAMFLLSRRLLPKPRSPGWVLIDPKKRRIRVELQDDAGGFTRRDYAYEDLKDLFVRPVFLDPEEEDPPTIGKVRHELVLDMGNDETYPLSRLYTRHSAEKLRSRLQHYLSPATTEKAGTTR